MSTGPPRKVHKLQSWAQAPLPGELQRETGLHFSGEQLCSEALENEILGRGVLLRLPEDQQRQVHWNPSPRRRRSQRIRLLGLRFGYHRQGLEDLCELAGRRR